MKLFVAALALVALAASPALAEKSPVQPRAKRDPNEVICKLQQTTAGIPQRVCITRAEWAKENTRLRQDMMLSQRGFCGGGSAC